MKRFLPLLIVLVSFAQANSQTSRLLMSENFTGYNNGNLNGQDSWKATGNDSYVQVAKTTPLIYSGYVSGTQYISTVENPDAWWGLVQPDDPYKNFIGGATVSTGTVATYYMTFLVRVPSKNGTAAINAARPTVALRTSGGGTLANFYIADDGNDLKFGINKDGGTNGVYASTDYAFGTTTHLIVIRYDVVSGNNNDKMYLWVDPSIATEPSTATAKVSITNTGDGYSSGSVSSLQLFQEENSASASFDGINVAYGSNFPTTASNSLAAWNALHPVAAPLPVTFGDIKGYTKGLGIQIDWTVYTELNVDHYEIERSSDGVSFSKAGTIIAQGAEGTLYYNWFDATPSSGNNFYRIKNVDIDAKSTYSSIVRVSLGKSMTGGDITVYPNPVTSDHVSFQAGDLQKGDYKIEIFNMSGQQVYTKQLSHSGGAVSQTMQLPAGVKTGIYNIRITGSDFKIAKAFLVQ